jgi:hypothetical protein
MTNFLCFFASFSMVRRRVKNSCAWAKEREKKRLGKRDGSEAKHKGHQINDLQKMLVPAKMRHKLLNYLRASALAHS